MTREDLGRDAHLLAALRHAPDRDAAPPPALSAAILARAQAAVRPGRRAPGRWRDAIPSWFERPHLAAAFGTLAVAVLVGLMWSVQEPPLPAVSIPPAAPPAAPSPAGAEGRAPEAPPPTPRSASTDRSGATVKAPAPGRPAAERSKPASTAQVGTLSRSPLPSPSPAPTEGGGPSAPAAPAAAAPSPPAAAVERRALADDGVAGASRASAPPAPQASPRALNELRSRQESAAALALASKPSADLDEPMSRFDLLSSGAAAGLSWQLAGKAVPHGEAQRRWWAALREATRGRWVREATAREVLVPWVVLSAEGRSVATLWIENGTLLLREGPALWKAPATEAQLREWQEMVARW